LVTINNQPHRHFLILPRIVIGMAMELHFFEQSRIGHDDKFGA